MRSLNPLSAALGVGVWLCVSGTAAAAPGCSITSATGASFGRYDPLSTSPLTTSGNITLCCENPGPADYVTLDLDSGHSSTPSRRTMTQGADSLVYNLFMDSNLTQVWGDGFEGTGHYGPFLPGAGCTSIPVYGVMPAGQSVPAGSYSDVLTITVTF